MLLRLWMLVVLTLAGVLAPSRACAHVAETRTGDFFATATNSHQETESQVSEPHQGFAVFGYETASGYAQAAENAGTETFFRTMSQEHYEQLLNTRQIPATGETFVSPSLKYASGYDGVTVQFTVRGGTESSLLDIGLRNKGLLQAPYGELPLVDGMSWTSSNAFFKLERGVINIGLGKGAALDTFNSNIITFGLPK